MANSQSQLHQAHQLLKAKKYQQAYHLLKQMPDDPIAQEWLQKLEAMRKKKQQQQSASGSAIAPTAQVSPVPAKSKPAPPTNASSKKGENAAMQVYTLPHRKSKTVMKMVNVDNSALHVTPLGFLDMPERIDRQNVSIRWLNIQYNTDKGEVLGWVPEGTSNISYTMHKDDIPESTLPYNDKKQINKLISEIRVDSYLAMWGGAILILMGVLVIAGLIFGSNSQPTTSANICGGILLLYGGYTALIGLNGLLRWIIGGDRPRGQMIRYLKAVRLSKVTGQELSTAITATHKNEQQRNLAGGLAAGAVAVLGTVALAAAAANEVKKAQASPSTTKRTSTSNTKSSTTTAKTQSKATTNTTSAQQQKQYQKQQQQQFRQQEQRQQQQAQQREQQQQRMEEQRRRDEMANMQAHFNQQIYGHE